MYIAHSFYAVKLKSLQSTPGFFVVRTWLKYDTAFFTTTSAILKNISAGDLITLKLHLIYHCHSNIFSTWETIFLHSKYSRKTESQKLNEKSLDIHLRILLVLIKLPVREKIYQCSEKDDSDKDPYILLLRIQRISKFLLLLFQTRWKLLFWNRNTSSNTGSCDIIRNVNKN